MSVPIPLIRIKTIGVPRPILFSGNQEGSLGGEDLPIPRMGDRFAIDIATSQLLRGSETRNLIAALIEATTGDAIIPLLQPDARPQWSAAAVVDGAGQRGSILNVRQLLPGSGIGRGDFFSIVHAGRRYLHMTTANMIVPVDGKAAVPIWPMLRFITVDAEVCEFTQPHIEGRLVGFDARGATHSRSRIEPLQFSVVERA